MTPPTPEARAQWRALAEQTLARHWPEETEAELAKGVLALLAQEEQEEQTHQAESARDAAVQEVGRLREALEKMRQGDALLIKGALDPALAKDDPPHPNEVMLARALQRIYAALAAHGGS